VSISSTKFPFPEPIPFPAEAAHEPVKTPQPGWYCRYQIKKRHQSQRSDPATFLIVSGEDWPTAIRVLGVEQKVLSAFDVAYRCQPECERGVARGLNCGLRRRCQSSPSSARELPQRKFRQQGAENNSIGRHSGALCSANCLQCQNVARRPRSDRYKSNHCAVRETEN